jgi:putative transcriptional regulator
MNIPLLCGLLALNAAGISGIEPARIPDLEIAARESRPSLTAKPGKGQFLVAKRSVTDPNFSQTVILLLTYGDNGAMGLILNHPTEMRLASALPNIKELRDRPDRVFLGGPVAVNSLLLLVRAKTHPEGAQPIFGDVFVSGSLKVLHEALNPAAKAGRLRAYAGYAGWGPGQLEREIDRGDWLVAPADAAAIFERKPAEVWPKLFEQFSVEWTRNEDGLRLWDLPLRGTAWLPGTEPLRRLRDLQRVAGRGLVP